MHEFLQLLVAARPFLVVVMLAMFTALILWAYAPRRRVHLDECGRIPLRDDDSPVRDEF
jgi:cbb3-type cytochrome oxidase subunit 3